MEELHENAETLTEKLDFIIDADHRYGGYVNALKGYETDIESLFKNANDIFENTKKEFTGKLEEYYDKQKKDVDDKLKSAVTQISLKGENAIQKARNWEDIKEATGKEEPTEFLV